MSKYAVIDANIALHALHQSKTCRSLIDRLTDEEYELIAPELFIYEFVSALNKGIFINTFDPKDGITKDIAKQYLLLLSDFNIRLIDSSELDLEVVLDLTDSLQRKKAYDTFYLALANKYSCIFYTADSPFYNAILQKKVKNVEYIDPQIIINKVP